MVWLYEKYKEDERNAFVTIFKMAGQSSESSAKPQIRSAIDIICQGEVVVPQRVREGLRRVIQARRSASKFYILIQCAVSGTPPLFRPLQWLLYLLDKG